MSGLKVNRAIGATTIAIALIAAVACGTETDTSAAQSGRSAASGHVTAVRNLSFAANARPAPLSVEAAGTWWQQGAADGFSPSNLWRFDPVHEALPNGFRKGYQPTGYITPYSLQFSFTYSQSGDYLQLSFPSGTQQQIVLLDYNANTDTLTVDYEGHTEQWVGCQSGQMPAVALAACRN